MGPGVARGFEQLAISTWPLEVLNTTTLTELVVGLRAGQLQHDFIISSADQFVDRQTCSRASKELWTNWMLILLGYGRKARLDALQKQNRLGCYLVAENSPANVLKQTCGWGAPGSR
jgi:hypothetical protein